MNRSIEKKIFFIFERNILHFLQKIFCNLHSYQNGDLEFYLNYY